MPGDGFWKHGGFGKMGFLHKNYTGRFVPAAACHTRKIDCPERKEEVDFLDCLECGKFKVWHPLDGELKRCWHEFKDLEERGAYDGTWDEHPENFDPETFARLQERKRLNEEINRELESEMALLERKDEDVPAHYDPYGRDEDDFPEECPEDGDDDEDEYY